MSYHTIIIVGRLGKDPEMRYTPSGQAVTSFSVAADRSYNGQDGQLVKETTWFRVSVWGKQAESCNTYLSKGKMVLVEGRMTQDKAGGPRIWTDKEGNTRASFEVTAQMVRFLSSKSEGGGGGGAAEDMGDIVGNAEEIPF
jgi:single-strand DNA-binding protein